MLHLPHSEAKRRGIWTYPTESPAKGELNPHALLEEEEQRLELLCVQKRSKWDASFGVTELVWSSRCLTTRMGCARRWVNSAVECRFLSSTTTHRVYWAVVRLRGSSNTSPTQLGVTWLLRHTRVPSELSAAFSAGWSGHRRGPLWFDSVSSRVSFRVVVVAVVVAAFRMAAGGCVKQLELRFQPGSHLEPHKWFSSAQGALCVLVTHRQNLLCLLKALVWVRSEKAIVTTCCRLAHGVCFHLCLRSAGWKLAFPEYGKHCNFAQFSHTMT